MTDIVGASTYDDLARRLAEAEETLGAIQRGEVDGLVVFVDGRLRIYTLEGADAFYRALVEHMPEGAAAVTAQGRVLYANSCLAKMLGAPLESLIGADLLDSVDPFHRARVRTLLGENAEVDAGDLSLLHVTGESVPVAISVSPVDGHAEGVRCVVVVDLTRRLRAETETREAEARFRGAFDNAPSGMALLDLSGRVEMANAALCSIAGCSRLELIGRELPWLVREADDPDDVLGDLLSGEFAAASIERGGENPAGRTVWVAIQLRLVLGAGGRPLHFIAQVQDESDRRMHEEQLRHVADHDGLTGLLNRRGFEQALTQHFAVTTRYGPEGALVLLDVDHFKYINDTGGHHVGDRALIQLGEALRSRLRESDIIARLGGDEFAILLPRADATSAPLVAQQLVATARDVTYDGMVAGRRLTISAGVVAIGDVGRSSGELMALADLAMYDSKEAGRDRVTVYDDSPSGRSPTGSRHTWLGRIEAAIADGTLLLDAQPIVDLATGRIVQEELLVRLPGSDGRVPAGVWFSVAERYGLAPSIDAWVLDQALDLLVADAFPALNVNVSATSVSTGMLRDRVREGLARTKIDAARITFEITETAAIGNISAAVRFTEDLRSLGCRFALDDFGAGFGSFYYLKHLPFDDVKIDGEFVRDCVHSERDRAIISAMVHVATSMSRRTVAECIEDAETLAMVEEHAVDLAQGYHLGRPVPVDL